MKITSIQQQRKDPNRVSIFLDGEFAFGLAGKFLVDFDLFKDRELQEKEIAEILRKDIGEKLKTRIYKLVLSRPRSEKEARDYIQKKLREGKYKVEKEYWRELMESIISALKKLELINDSEFARWFVENRKRLQPRGKYLLRMELKKKGIDEEIIKKQLDFGNEEEMELARRLTEKKFKTLSRFDEKKRRGKLITLLQRKGFGWDVISEVVE